MQQNDRYQRQMILPEIGEIGQQKLINAKVLVIGAGGLGCAVLQNLAIAGVGTIGIVDGDVVDVSNLHRQVLYTSENIGQSKVNAALFTLKRINENINIETFNYFLDENFSENMIQKYDLIIDCTDNIATRYLINDLSIKNNKPFVYAAIHKFQGQVSVFNYQNGPSYRCLFPENKSELPTCETLGVLGVLPNIIGTFQANEALKFILNIGEVLSGKLLIYDSLSCESQIISFNKKQDEINKAFAQTYTSKTFKEIDYDEFIDKCKNKSIVKIDLRESNEVIDFEINNISKLPLESFLIQLDNWKKETEILLFCKSGIKSKYASETLIKEGFINVSHLKEGLKLIKE